MVQNIRKGSVESHPEAFPYSDVLRQPGRQRVRRRAHAIAHPLASRPPSTLRRWNERIDIEPAVGGWIGQVAVPYLVRPYSRCSGSFIQIGRAQCSVALIRSGERPCLVEKNCAELPPTEHAIYKTVGSRQVWPPVSER
jgi:hypothetical protein